MSVENKKQDWYKLSDKIDFSVQCLYCNNEIKTVAYLNCDDLFCDNCEKDVEVGIFVPDYEIRVV